MKNANSIEVGQRVSYVMGGDCYMAEVVAVSARRDTVTVRDLYVLQRDEHGETVRYDAEDEVLTHFSRRTVGAVTYYQRKHTSNVWLDFGCVS